MITVLVDDGFVVAMGLFFHRLSPGVDLALQPDHGSLRIAQVALENYSAGPVRIYLDDVLLCRLSSGVPQASLCILVSRTATLRSQGAQSAAVHVVGQCRGDPFVVAAPKRIEAAPSHTASPKQLAPAPAPPPKQVAPEPASKRSILSPKRPRANSLPRPARVQRLSWGADVLVAEYVPKKGGPTLGISPERRSMSLDEMEAAQEARRLEEEEEEGEEEEEE